jgi:hypothetical protein
MYTNQEEFVDDNEYTNDNEEHLSKIRVIYNNKFIAFINKLRRDKDLSDLYLHDLERVLPLQEELREYIVNNQKLFELQYGQLDFGSNSYPDFFAIMICIIIPNLEEYTNFNEILDISKKGLWEFSLYSSETNEEGFEPYAANHFKCACNHNCGPENLYIINNIESQKNILIGSDCASKCGFIEPEKIEKIKAEREVNPKYKKFMEMSERRNEEKYKYDVEKTLKKYKISKEEIENKYEYFGGNYSYHETFFNFQKKFYEINSIDEFILDNCQICYRKTKNKLLIKNDEGDFYCICVKCCSYFGKIPKKKGICEECGEAHNNRSDNYCNDCRKKTYCLKCNERTDDTLHCKECVSKYNFCVDCHINEVGTKGWRCKGCFNKLKKCKCGKPLTNRKYKVCYNCKINR